MSPTPRLAWLVAALAAAALVAPIGLVVLVGVALVGAALADWRGARTRPQVATTVPSIVARGVPADVTVVTDPHVRVRLPTPPDIRIEPREADGRLDALLTARRRGRHVLPAAVTRTTGPLGLVRVDRRVGDDIEIAVYPDLPSARAVVALVRQGRRGEGRRRGVLGIGTEFESVREYAPDDDVRQVNWRATVRVGRPMSNQFRIDQDRDVLCLVDTGRLMSAPLGDRTRLDAALDAVTAVALVADELGDRCGALAFDGVVRRRVAPRRGGGRPVVEALFDLEPTPVDSDYDLAFRALGGKRACVLLFTDLIEPAAARPLLEAVPWLARRHAVIVASSRDTDLESMLRTPPADPVDTYAAAVAVEVLDARSAVAGRLTDAGVVVVEADPGQLGSACVTAYLRLKSRALV